MIEKNLYDSTDPWAYENRRNQNSREEYLYEHWEPVISNFIIEYSKDSIVLDLGCGTGNYSFKIAKYAKKVFAVDSSKRMLNYAKSKYLGVNFIYADATETPIENNCIDTVFSFGLFEFVNKEKLVKEIFRVLKPNGIGVISAPNIYSIPRFLFAIFYKILNKKRRCHEPSFGQMMKFFSKYNFKVIKYKMDDGLFWLPGKLEKIFGKKTYLFIENCFKTFKRNPFSSNMIFVIKKMERI
jgi:ubiquinone/menaquinone biosynthesis C-methylase UbiE